LSGLIQQARFLQTQCLKTINSYHASICAATSPAVAENA
jgi:hypothetical protein